MPQSSKPKSRIGRPKGRVKPPVTPEQKKDIDELGKSIKKLPEKRQKMLDELMTKKLLDSQEVCAIMGVSLPTLRRWLARGEIKFVKISRYLRFPSEEVFRLMQHQEALGVPEVAEILGVGVFAIRNMISRGEIKAFRISETGHYKIARSEVERLMSSGSQKEGDNVKKQA